MEPLSITTGVVSLLGVCLRLGVELKRLRIGAREASTTVTAMLADVSSLRAVLTSMEESFEELDTAGPSASTTGHVAAHLAHIRRSLVDGGRSLGKIETLLAEVNREVGFLDATRRHLRLKDAADQLATYRQEVQVYRDALQLSLETMSVFGQISIKQDTQRLLASTEAMHSDISRLATNLDVKLRSLETVFRANDRHGDLDAVVNLRDCVRSAASVVSGPATTVFEPDAAGAADVASEVDFDFSDWLRFDQSSTLGWVMGDGRWPAESSGLAAVPPPEPSTSNPPRFALFPPAPAVRRIELYDPPRFDSPPPQQHQQQQQQQQVITTAATSTDEDAKSAVVAKRHSSVNLKPKLSSDTQPDSLATSHTPPRGHKPKSFSLSALFSRPKDVRATEASRDLRRYQAKHTVSRKMVFVGDGACGKTCFIIRASKGVMPEVYVPTVFENYVGDFTLDSMAIEAGLWDTAGQEDYDRIRPLSYPDTHIFCLCFTIDSPDSLDNVCEKWISEIKHFNTKRSPIYLIGLKKDLRGDPNTIGRLINYNQRPVTYAEGDRIRQQIGAEAYFECSAKTGEGVDDAFDGIFRSYFQRGVKPGKGGLRSFFA